MGQARAIRVAQRRSLHLLQARLNVRVNLSDRWGLRQVLIVRQAPIRRIVVIGRRDDFYGFSRRGCDGPTGVYQGRAQVFGVGAPSAHVYLRLA